MAQGMLSAHAQWPHQMVRLLFFYEMRKILCIKEIGHRTSRCDRSKSAQDFHELQFGAVPFSTTFLFHEDCTGRI